MADPEKEKENKTVKKVSERKVSEEFWNVLCHGGSIRATCEFCGITYFIDDPTDYDEGELEDLQAKQKLYPNKFITLEYEPSLGNIDGKQAVRECPCNSVRKYEDFIWDNRYLIADYLTERTKKEEKEAKENSKLAKMVNQATKR